MLEGIFFHIYVYTNPTHDAWQAGVFSVIPQRSSGCKSNATLALPHPDLDSKLLALWIDQRDLLNAGFNFFTQHFDL